MPRLIGQCAVMIDTGLPRQMSNFLQGSFFNGPLKLPSPVPAYKDLRLPFDSDINKGCHEDKKRVSGRSGICTTIQVGDRVLPFTDRIESVSDAIHEMPVSKGELLVASLGEVKHQGRHFRLADVRDHVVKAVLA